MLKHFCIFAFIALGAGLPQEAQEKALLQTWDEALDTQASSVKTQDTPVTRVVKLLQEMQATLKKEMDEDEELYEKLACWCSNNDREKTAAIEQAEATIADLESTIEALSARSKELQQQIKESEEELANDKQELEEATKIRDKQMKEFHQDEVESIQAVENLKAAIMVLAKHHGAFPQLAFLGVSKRGSRRKAVKKGIWDVNHESSDDLALDRFMEHNDYAAALSNDDTTSEQTSHQFLQQREQVPVSEAAGASGFTAQEIAILKRAKVTALAQNKEDIFARPYAAQSGEILGILKQLKETFESNLSQTQKDEMSRAAAFAELKDSKLKEIEAGEKMLDEKTAQLADTDQKKVDAKEELEDTKNSLSEDQKFVIMMKKACSQGDEDWALRKKTRLEEMQAIGDTIHILTEDEARDAMNGTFNKAAASLVQLRAESRFVEERKRAAKILKDVAMKHKDPQLSILATSVQLDAFTRVKKAMDDMVAMLKQQQEDEVKKKDYCDQGLHENEMDTAKKTDIKSDLEAEIDDLSATIDKLASSLTQTKAEIQDAKVSLQRANENRQNENHDFQKTIADQRATQEVLHKALDRLATFYDAQLVQLRSKAGKGRQPDPPAEFQHLKGYNSNAGGSGVMSMIEKLIGDAKQLEKDAVAAEQDAQTAYENFVANTNASVAEKETAVVNMTEEKAQAEQQRESQNEALEAVKVELNELQKLNGQLHEECDYILKNFDIRQTARQQEIEAIQQAKQILAGAMQ